MSKLNPSFIDEMEKDIKDAQKNAEVIVDTQVVNFKPKFGDGVTQESLDKHVDFINRQGAIVHAGTSNIGFEHFEQVGDKEWTGVMDLGALQITAHTSVRDTVDADNHMFGNADLFFDYRHSDDLNAWYDSFVEKDHDRCSKLFEEEPAN